MESVRQDRRSIGIIAGDVTNSRLLSSASIHLGLEPLVTRLDELSESQLMSMELVIADLDVADAILERLSNSREGDDPYRPAVIAILPPGTDMKHHDGLKSYDGILPMPQLPDTLSAQLSVALYSHRAFARRYENQLEELHLSRQIFGSVASGISVANATKEDLPLVYVNPAFEALTGYTLEDCRGKNCRFLQRDDRNQPGLTLLREAIRDGSNTVAILRNYKKDGTPFWNELSLSPIRSKEGEVTHFIGIQEDVTERVEFEQALRESEKLAVTGRLAAAIAHEINNPLESITNLTYLARRSNSLPEIHNYLDTLDGELRRVKLITAQALRFARQSSREEAIDATQLLDSVLDIQHARIQVSRVRVAKRFRFAQSFVAFESEIRQVLNNLVSNATDAMRSGGGTLFVRSKHATDWRTNRQGVMFTIADTGSGMTLETQSKLYKAFYSTKGTQGTGLGLWVSSEIVDRHHGRLKFRSSSSGSHTGSVFQLFLPYQGAAPESEEAASK